MNRKRRQAGFTTAEILIVVALIVVLAAVSFIMVQRYQRAMTQLEYDTVAKELFVAAQNHLTAAESQGYLNQPAASYGTRDRDVTDRDVYYFSVNSGAADSGNMLEKMLPFGAIDETVRGAGSYLIRYQPSSGRVLDVFYSDPNRTSFLTVRGITLSRDDYSTLMGEGYYGEEKRIERRNYRGAVVGWYGGGDDLPVGLPIAPPVLKVENAETLRLVVTEENPKTDGQSLVLLLTGETSGAKKTIALRKAGTAAVSDATGFLTVSSTGLAGTEYTIVLDDVTKDGLHFAQLKADTGSFVPGENLRIEAVSFNNSVLTNIASSGKSRTNSLFGDLVENGTAVVSNYRHLENLDASISGLKSASTVTKATQTGNLSWPSFLESVGGSETNPVRIHPLTGTASENNCFLPVNPSYSGESGSPESFALAYDGKDHAVSGLKVNFAGNAGVFGSLQGGSVSSLKVLDSDIRSSSSSASNASAGGIAGETNGTTLTGCASTAVVSGKTAGGLVGFSNGGSISACYSGGHTTKGEYVCDGTAAHPFDVTGTTVAGGLIGESAGTDIRYCYSTCSVIAATAGGFAGSASGSIRDSYCTGLVSGSGSAGAFVGSWNGTTSSGNRYYQIINGDLEPGAGGVTALDQGLDTYNAFVGVPDHWAAARPADNTLKTYYQGKFNLRTTDQLATGEKSRSSEIHYGDWPAPEILFINN